MSLAFPEDLPKPLFSSLPRLPEVISYYDDFSDSHDEVRNLHENLWRINFNGATRAIDFAEIDIQLREVVKIWIAFLLADLSPVTADMYFNLVRLLPASLLIGLLTCEPRDLRTRWKTLHTSGVRYHAFGALSSIMSFLCKFTIGPWNSSWMDLISQLPYPKKDKYASVRVGDVFLSVTESARIVSHIDQVCLSLDSGPTRVTDEVLENTCILVCSYEHGFRAKQIAMLEMRNIRIWQDGLDSRPAVHLTFVMIKQRTEKKVFQMVRKIKRDWSRLFVELFERAKSRGLSGKDHIFQQTPGTLSTALSNFVESISEKRRGTGDLRHSYAQRMVDKGASNEELAFALGHTDLDTPLVYFRSSQAQADRINQALGLSETYRNVIKIAHAKFISLDDLTILKGDQQIAGMPHGVPISGIGGCESGQPACPFNPVTSCYGCPRFMPLSSVSVHEAVLEDMREIVRLFYASSHAERSSPAFQLESTISNIQKIISELKGPRHELES